MRLRSRRGSRHTVNSLAFGDYYISQLSTPCPFSELTTW
ncbi:hypothetical protein SLNWT_0128 [Streptomyces albus]|uniref:Uncharacterized protein n=1 Tax=Streptomyces albus (strain ATCC 21838 / DSM 41398 / FERM P-419 / JCM 4703 / NBRC 107858) TaxID=1081613 RepID=A0A0B5EGN4_STRA4|nr:hypothetical protein SLNWT_0128 [Streptomyces albus]AOU74823.1 hypothetical protein SLNHY_0132 [Streptomyces albus]